MTSRTLEIARLLRQRDSLREFIESISSELALQPLLTRLLRHACELLEVAHGAIGLYDEEAGAIRITAAHGLPEGEIGTLRGPGSGVAGQVLLTRRTVVVDRYSSVPDPAWPELSDHAVIGVPVFWGSRLVGFFGVGAPPPRRFDAKDEETLTLFARHAAVAIENAQRYERERRRTERLVLIGRVGRIITSGLDLGGVLQKTADAIHDVLGYPNVDIPLVDADDPGTLVIRTRGGQYKRLISREDRLPVTEGIMGAAARERRMQLVNDVSLDARYVRPPVGEVGIRAELAVPILLGEDVLGVVNVESATPFTEDDAGSLQVVADHLALAIRNARLFESGQRAAVMEERQRLSRDLHDSVTQLLFSVSLLAQSLGSAWRRDAAEGERQTRRLVDLSRFALSEMRSLVAALHPSSDPGEAPPPELGLRTRLREVGLPGALAHLVQQVFGDSLEVGLETASYTALPVEREEALYRLAQEALSNVQKHAGARCVALELSSRGGETHLEVRDDGRGFDVRHPPRAPREGSVEGGFGLGMMRERVELLGGRLLIRSRRGHGTTVEISIPPDS